MRRASPDEANSSDRVVVSLFLPSALVTLLAFSASALTGVVLIGVALPLGALGASAMLTDLGIRLGLGRALGWAVSIASPILLLLGLAFVVVALFIGARGIRRTCRRRRSPVAADADSSPHHPVAESGAGRIDRLLAGSFLVILTTFASFIALDVLVGVFAPANVTAFERRFAPEVVRKPSPYTMFTGTPNGVAKGVTLNALGYRGPVPQTPKPPGEFRIFMLGGSTTVNGYPPIAAQLERALQERGDPNVRVFNYGVVSSVSGMELVRILTAVVDHQPDLVMMYNAANDIIQPLMWDPRPGYPFNFAAYENNPLLNRDPRAYPTAALLAYRSNILKMVGSKYFLEEFAHIDALRESHGYRSEHWRRDIASIYVSNLQKAFRVAQSFGAEFLAIIQPTIYFKDQPGREDPDIFGADTDVRAHSIDVREKIRELLASRSDAFRTRVIDLSDVFDEHPVAVYRDPVHLQQHGRERITAAILPHLIVRISSQRNREATSSR